MFDSSRLLGNRSYAVYAVITAAAVALILYFGLQQSAQPLPLHYNGTNGNITVAKALSLSAKLQNQSTVQILPSSNKIVFTSKNVSVVVLNIDTSEAAGISNFNTSRYHGNILVIFGLVYPTVVLPDNAVLNVTFVNLDTDGSCGVFINYMNPAFDFEATPSGLYNSSGFKTPLLGQFNSPSGQARAAYAPNTPLGHFNSLWYLSSCSSNVTYGTLYNGALYR